MFLQSSSRTSQTLRKKDRDTEVQNDTYVQITVDSHAQLNGRKELREETIKNKKVWIVKESGW